MLEIFIGYEVQDKEGRSFRPLGDIARNIEEELFLNSTLFSEASYYKIIVANAHNADHSVIECFKNKEEREALMKGEKNDKRTSN